MSKLPSAAAVTSSTISSTCFKQSVVGGAGAALSPVVFPPLLVLGLSHSKLHNGARPCWGRRQEENLSRRAAAATAATRGVVRIRVSATEIVPSDTPFTECKSSTASFSDQGARAATGKEVDTVPDAAAFYAKAAEILELQTPEAATTSQENMDSSSEPPQRLIIKRPDDWHLHVRDGDVLSSVVPHSASAFGRAIIMPNLKPPVTTVAAALAYRDRIVSALPGDSDFEPLMTLYLTDSTTKDEITRAKESGAVVAVKLYPAGATTNSQAGVTDLFGKCMPVLEEMAEQGLPLLVHGEVADQDVDIFDRERVFIATVLSPLVKRLPHLKIVMEHITTQDAVEFIESRSNGLLAATVTPQHLLLNRNAIFKGGLQPHNYCLPVLKREKHRQALVAAVTSGSKQYFLGTDSAPHERHTKESSCGCAGIYSSPIALPLYAQVFDQAGALDKLEAFASLNGPLFYGLPVNNSTVTLEKVPWKVPTGYKFGSGVVIPICAGETLQWSLTQQ